jgi:hypothetical protein
MRVISIVVNVKKLGKNLKFLENLDLCEWAWPRTKLAICQKVSRPKKACKYPLELKKCHSYDPRNRHLTKITIFGIGCHGNRILTNVRRSDFGRFLLCYSRHPIGQKTWEKKRRFVAICSGFGHFFRRLTGLKCCYTEAFSLAQWGKN